MDLSAKSVGASYVQPIAPRESGTERASKRSSSSAFHVGNDEPHTKSGGSRASSAKRAHKRTYHSALSGPKLLAPLKKRDGEALWRRDIQYDFLNAVFSDKTKAFTSKSSSERLTFAEVYLQAMANSTRCSKILGEKLLGDHKAGIKIAMVCLLVNWGRMNTTLNFFPEMKTVLRTYHPIPSLQTHDAPDYKQLQDAPRLKSILKGACEASNEPTSIQELDWCKKRPRTNPINLVFLMSAFSRVVERQMIPENEFTYFDLLMDSTKSSKSRAKAFLFLVWAYLESPDIFDHSSNPFGERIPFLDQVDTSESQTENIDTPAELLFGNQMTLQRLAILDTPSSGSDEVESVRSDKSEKANGHDRADRQADVPLVTPKPRLRSAKDRRINDEFIALLRHKRQDRKARRLARNNAIRDTWNRIQDLDPLYDSDEDRAQAKVNGKSHDLGLGVVAAGIGTKYSDYGENSLSIAVALKRASKRLSEVKTETS